VSTALTSLPSPGIVLFVWHFEGAKGNVADRCIKKAVRKVCVLKPLDSDGGFLMELLDDAPADAV